MGFLNFLFVGLFVFLLFSSGCVQESEGLSFKGLEQGIVEGVTDGDTLVLENGKRLRLIGIDAPEKGERCFEEAKNRLRGLVLGKGVILVKDYSERDKYGRLVRFVYIDGLFVNLVLVEEGLALAFPFEPDTSKAEAFRQAQEMAADGNGCIWRKE